MKLREIGEFGLIPRIKKSGPASSPGVFKAIGDDAGVSGFLPVNDLVSTVDQLIEDVYFELSWVSPFKLGRKWAAVNISDLAAVGAIPRRVLISPAVPPRLNIEFLDDLFSGMKTMEQSHGVSPIGGISPLLRSSRLQNSKLWPKDGLLRSPPHRKNRILGSQKGPAG